MDFIQKKQEELEKKQREMEKKITDKAMAALGVSDIFFQDLKEFDEQKEEEEGEQKQEEEKEEKEKKIQKKKAQKIFTPLKTITPIQLTRKEKKQIKN